ncbi:MAG TPA: TIGR02996 domain-containing protein [Gemmataceae bacterium]|jgi:uncharacterized protein (TIGR02996 family)
MNHERAFLQAIRDEPDDDAHRLIYADWLEEQGGAARTARAVFIRAQCRLAALATDDPGRDALEDEADDVLSEYEREWTEPLHGLAEKWRFSRGFIESITLRGGDFLTHAERLFDFAPLRAVHLLIKNEDIPRLAACPQLCWVETLDFRRCQLNDRALQQLLTSPHLERLTALDLAGNGISTPGIRSLVHSTSFARLRRLDLSRNIGVGDMAVRLLAHAPPVENLEELNLAATAATLDSLRELFHSSHLPRLTRLNIAGTRAYWAQLTSPLRILAESKLLRQLCSLDISEHAHPSGLSSLLDSLGEGHLQALYLRRISATNESAELLASSPSLANLTTLDLQQNNLGAAGMQTLADSPYLAALTHLDVGSNNLRDTGAKALAESPHLRRLTVLELAGNGIGGPGLQALATSDNLDRLRTLKLAGNFIGGDSVRALAESAHVGRLAHLDLSDAYLEENSAGVLAGAANLARLRTLRLQKNLLGDGGARVLAQSPHLKRLTILDLNDNRIGKAGAEALAAAPHWRHLRQLDLRGNVFTDAQEMLLRSRFGSAVLL